METNITKLLQERYNINNVELLKKLRSNFSLLEILVIYNELHRHIGSIDKSSNHPFDSLMKDRNQFLVLEYIFDRGSEN
jgi:hypothetical protein